MAARSAESRSCHDRTVPVSVTVLPRHDDVEATRVDIGIVVQGTHDPRPDVVSAGTTTRRLTSPLMPLT